MRRLLLVALLFGICVVGPSTQALTFSATGPGDNLGETLKASATFTVSNLNLVVTLSNDATFDPNDDEDILTGIFFSIAGNPHLTPVSAELPDDSFIIAHKLPLGFDGDVGTQWAYDSNLTKTPQDANQGISSTGLKLFNNKDLFPGEKMKGGGSFGGISYGLTTITDLPANNKTIKNQALIQSDVVFTFTGLPLDFDLSQISDVTFQYGTSFKAPELLVPNQSVPEPPTIALVTIALAAAIARRRWSSTFAP